MRELGNIDIQKGLKDTFEDIEKLANQCQFSDCTHTKEKGCAILAALSNGTLSEKQYQNYLKLKKETEHHKLSYVEKRQKDKNFGKMVKRVLKTKKKEKEIPEF